MKINSIKINKNFMYLWLKSVDGVDLSNHCAKCLLGKYDDRVNNKIIEKHNIELDDNKIYYLCGVSKPYVWNNNFHLAFRYKENSVIKYENNGIEVIINNAEMLPINEKYIDKSDINANKKEYYTCRNWQFAYYYKNYLMRGE